MRKPWSIVLVAVTALLFVGLAGFLPAAQAAATTLHDFESGREGFQRLNSRTYGLTRSTQWGYTGNASLVFEANFDSTQWLTAGVIRHPASPQNFGDQGYTKMSARIFVAPDAPSNMLAVFFYQHSSWDWHTGNYTTLVPGQWTEVSVEGSASDLNDVAAYGVEVHSNHNVVQGYFHVDTFQVSGSGTAPTPTPTTEPTPEPTATPTPTPEPTPPPSTGLSVSGNQIVDNGNPVYLHGINRSGTQYACVEGWGFYDGPVDDAALDAIASWNVNTVRVSLNEHCWLGVEGAPAAYSGANYQNEMANFVSRLNAHGFYVILDLHWNAPKGQLARSQQLAADKDYAPAFWQSVANRFKDNPYVMFELYNEPLPMAHDWNSAWNCVRYGSTAAYQSPCSDVPFAVASTQEMVDAIRGTGATNIILVPGVHWTNLIDRWIEFKPNDPANQLAAAWHTYNFSPITSIDEFNATVAPVAQHYPVVATEVGQDGCAHNWTAPVYDWMTQNGVHIMGWSWVTSSCSSEPALISNYNGTPTNYGVGLRDHFLSLP